MNYPRPGFLYDCNNQSLILLQLLKCTLTNPAGSGTKIILEAYCIPNMSSVASMATLTIDPTGGLPTTSFAPMPYVIDVNYQAPNNIGVFKGNVTASTAPLTGGMTVATVPVKPSDRNYIEAAPITLLPGHSLGFQLSPGVAMANVTFVVYTREEKI